MTPEAPRRTDLTRRFDEAVQFAIDLHRQQRRKGSGVPYIGHLLGTAGLVLHFGGDEDQAIAALLHDAAEDQGGRPTLEAIRARFGDRVAAIVEACTDSFEENKPAWRPRKEAYLARLAHKPLDVRLVSAADKLDNARAIVADLRQQGPRFWDLFTGGPQSLWYYQSLADIFRRTGTGPIAEELAAVVDEMVRLTGVSVELVEAYVKSRYVARRPGPSEEALELRIGAGHPALDHDRWAILTAYNPRSVRRADDENQRAHQALKAELERRATHVWAAFSEAAPGEPPWHEPMWLAVGIDLEAARELARRYEQNAIVYAEPGGPARLMLA